MNQTTYEQLKKQVQGFYFKFNTDVLRFHMNKIWDYEFLLQTASEFPTFTEFYKYHTKDKWEIISQHIDLMWHEAQRKGLKCDRETVQNCLTVRLGNVYNGMSTEHNIISTFQNLSPYISCEKTTKEVDMLYKVDGIIELAGVDKISIQIKPISFLSYDKGSEIQWHKQFEKEYGIKVYYVFYLNRNTIKFNNITINLKNTNEIIKQIETIILG